MLGSIGETTNPASRKHIAHGRQARSNKEWQSLVSESLVTLIVLHSWLVQ